MNMEKDSSSAPLMRLLNGLADLHSDSTLSDFTISYGERSWLVHRAVLAIQSSVLSKACTSDFQEATERTIDLSSDDPACIDAMVHYFYNLDYPEPSADPLRFHVQMCVLADKYDIAPLLKLATDQFIADATKLCETPDRLHAESFAEAALLAYETPQVTRGICNSITLLAIKFDLMNPKHRSETSSSAFIDAMRQCAGLAADVAMALYDQGRARPSARK